MSAVDTAYSELVRKYGPPAEYGPARRKWFTDHRDEMHAICARIQRGEPNPTPDLFSTEEPNA